jgi:hypothetical protein
MAFEIAEFVDCPGDSPGTAATAARISLSSLRSKSYASRVSTSLGWAASLGPNAPSAHASPASPDRSGSAASADRASRYLLVAITDSVADGRQMPLATPPARWTAGRDWRLVFLGVRPQAEQRLRQTAARGGFADSQRIPIVPFPALASERRRNQRDQPTTHIDHLQERARSSGDTPL